MPKETHRNLLPSAHHHVLRSADSLNPRLQIRMTSRPERSEVQEWPDAELVTVSDPQKRVEYSSDTKMSPSRRLQVLHQWTPARLAVAGFGLKAT